MKKKLSCKIFGHHFSRIPKKDLLIEEYECSHCKQKFTTDGYGRMVKRNKYWEDNNYMFENKLKNRTVA